MYWLYMGEKKEKLIIFFICTTAIYMLYYVKSKRDIQIKKRKWKLIIINSYVITIIKLIQMQKILRLI